MLNVGQIRGMAEIITNRRRTPHERRGRLTTYGLRTWREPNGGSMRKNIEGVTSARFDKIEEKNLTWHRNNTANRRLSSRAMGRSRRLHHVVPAWPVGPASISGFPANSAGKRPKLSEWSEMTRTSSGRDISTRSPPDAVNSSPRANGMRPRSRAACRRQPRQVRRWCAGACRSRQAPEAGKTHGLDMPLVLGSAPPPPLGPAPPSWRSSPTRICCCCLASCLASVAPSP